MVHDHVLVILAGHEVDAPGVGNVDDFHIAGFRPLGEVKGGVHLDAAKRDFEGDLYEFGRAVGDDFELHVLHRLVMATERLITRRAMVGVRYSSGGVGFSAKY